MEKIHSLIKMVDALLDSDDVGDLQREICRIVHNDRKDLSQTVLCADVQCRDCFFNCSSTGRENKESKEQLAKLKLILNMAE